MQFHWKIKTDPDSCVLMLWRRRSFQERREMGTLWMGERWILCQGGFGWPSCEWLIAQLGMALTHLVWPSQHRVRNTSLVGWHFTIPP